MTVKCPNLFDKSVLWWPGQHTLVTNAAKTITASGNVTQVLPFPGAGALYLDGGNDTHIAPPSSSEFIIGTGPFTMECWIFPISWSTNGAYPSTILAAQTTNGLQIGKVGVNAYFGIALAGTEWIITNWTCPSLNTLTHIKVTRNSSGLTRYFLNGILSASTTMTTNFSGYTGHVGATFNGWISEFVLKNTCDYDSDLPFTPPKYKLKSDAGTLLLLHFDVTGTTFTDSSSYNHTITPYGNAYQITPRVTDGGLVYLDGNEDYLTVGSPSAFTFGANDFTIEFDVILDSSSQNQQIFKFGTSGSYEFVFMYNWSGSNAFTWYCYTGSYVVNINHQTIPSLHTPYNICIERYNNTWTLYVNGVANTTPGSWSGTITTPSDVVIGSMSWDTGHTYYKGYLSELRVSLSTARHKGAFTPSTQRFTPDQYTKLLLHFDGIYQTFLDSPYNDYDEFPIIPSGCTVSNTGTFSKLDLGNNQKVMVFDGSTNHIDISDNASWFFGTDPFSIAFWIKSPNVTSPQYVWNQQTDGNNQHLSYIYVGSIKWTNYHTGAYQWEFGNSISANTWTFVVLVRNGASQKMYLNAVLGANQGTSAAAVNDYSGTWTFGYLPGYGYNWGGSLKDFIVWKGRALTLPEIKMLMNLTDPIAGPGIIQGPYDYWRLS